MSTEDTIKVGDIVSVNMHGAQFTLCPKAEVMAIPVATGDSWVFKEIVPDYETEQRIFYVSEGCTVAKIRFKKTSAEVPF